MRVRAESLLAWAAAGVGLVAIVSALTPELARRSDVVGGLLPAGVPEAARIVTLAFGVGLVWLSRSLAARRRRAWQLAVAVVAGLTVSHLAKGLDVEEAAVGLVLLAALVRYGSRFDVPGDRASLRPLLATVALLATALAWFGYATVHGTSFPDRLTDLLGAASLLLAYAALYLWLRPLSERVRQSVEEHRAAQRIVEAYGRDSLAFFTLRRDKSYLFSPSRRAFLAYRVVNGTALVSGDPVGDESELDALLGELRRLARARGWRIAVLGAGAGQLARYRALGMRTLKLGDEAVVRVPEFSLEGRPIRKVRQSVSRLTRAGYRLRIVPVGDVDSLLRTRLDAVSAEWRGSQPERGFSMAMDELYAPHTLLAIAEDERGEIGGFLHLVPSPAAGGYSLSTMRRRTQTPNGLMEFLVVQTVVWAREHGVSELSLNFCAFTDVLDSEGGGWRSVARPALLGADRFFQLERLRVFNKKFSPEWRPRYLCIERLGDLPLVALAYLRVEQLLVPPGPWVRTRNPAQRMQH
jgi:lysylphosphatidylglycerol synthetase-like protein (DUF2156 family)